MTVTFHPYKPSKKGRFTMRFTYADVILTLILITLIVVAASDSINFG